MPFFKTSVEDAVDCFGCMNAIAKNQIVIFYVERRILAGMVLDLVPECDQSSRTGGLIITTVHNRYFSSSSFPAGHTYLTSHTCINMKKQQ